jgi:uncharacterized membrane protein (DUF2068 family)
MPEGGELLTATGVVLCVFGVFMLVSVYGLWTLQAWGGSLAVWLAVVSILFGVIAIFPIFPSQEFTVANTVLQLIGIGVAVLVIRYLKSHRINALFIVEPA